MPRVYALIVTRNRRQLLVECLRGLLAGSRVPDGIIVYDNASTDGTAELLAEEGLAQLPIVDFHRSEVNVGGAGGFADILALGLKTDADWLWLMDDDAEPRPDALARLLADPLAADPMTAALCTAVVHGDGTIDPLHRCRVGRFVTPLPLCAYGPGIRADVPCASFVGLLVRSTAARGAGLPRREFFLGYDDAEYSLRLRDHGHVRLVPEAVIVHKIVVGGGLQTYRAAFWNRVLGWSYTSAPWDSYWKDLYRLRNVVALRRAHGGISAAGLAIVIAGYVVRTLLYDQRPLRRVPWIIRYALKGFRGDFAAPSPDAWAAWATQRRP